MPISCSEYREISLDTEKIVYFPKLAFIHKICAISWSSHFSSRKLKYVSNGKAHIFPIFQYRFLINIRSYNALDFTRHTHSPARFQSSSIREMQQKIIGVYLLSKKRREKEYLWRRRKLFRCFCFSAIISKHWNIFDAPLFLQIDSVRPICYAWRLRCAIFLRRYFFIHSLFGVRPVNVWVGSEGVHTTFLSITSSSAGMRILA